MNDTQINDTQINDTQMNNRDFLIMEAISKYSKKRTTNYVQEPVVVTKKNKIIFIILPQWAPHLPLYGIAKLVAVTKKAGYSTDVADINILAYRERKKWNLDYDPWDGQKTWKWGTAHKELLIHMQPLMEKYIDYIIANEITVVGFTLFANNIKLTHWMSREIKKRCKDITIIVGGSECHTSPPDSTNSQYDYIISGEGEVRLLEVLEKIETKNTVLKSLSKIMTSSIDERLDINKLPWADYSNFDLSLYNYSGVCSEMSRGCVAKCTFCSETHYWKYRYRLAQDMVNEVINLHKKYGITFIWFIDSLVNGNLNELRAFCAGIIASKIEISWTGYARCDDRMDLEYFKDLASSGCRSLNYGIESGSQQILNDMNKNLTIAEIEQTLKNGNEVDISASTNWIIGFPTETISDVYKSFTLYCRNRLFISSVSLSKGYRWEPDMITSHNPIKYNVLDSILYLGHYTTINFHNTVINRSVRHFSFSILLQLNPSKKNIHNNFDISKYVDIKFNNNNIFNTIEFEEFDTNIIKISINPLADNLVNEIWPLLRTLWKTRGGYTASIEVNPKFYAKELSGYFDCNFNATYNFKIDDLGNWDAHFNFNLIQDNNAWTQNKTLMDLSIFRDGRTIHNLDSIAVQRAKNMSMSDAKGIIKLDLKKNNNIVPTFQEISKLDFSFEYEYINSGIWQ